MRYKTTSYIEAFQFDRTEKNLPREIYSDGKGSAADDVRYNYFLRTKAGAVGLSNGDYVITLLDGTKDKVAKEIFEEIYEKAE